MNFGAPATLISLYIVERVDDLAAEFGIAGPGLSPSPPL
jgi:hypothetical protein